MEKKKICKTCKKNEELKELPSVELVMAEEIIPTPDDIVWGNLHDAAVLNDPAILNHTKTIYELVTGFKLDAAGCFSCKGAKYKNPFKWYANHKYGVELR
jgi:hypothetical protein